eukprot:TRINITY_DN1972_c0_g1_i2.p1 TRINITY_DN1972_c0_g1~~TRINITY_DN1972_c0_g1_i2.p1  ORF type:complete len:679 (-),score=113.99 TRINITY_DN1972_c0_g1_i2:79-1905(-)
MREDKSDESNKAPEAWDGKILVPFCPESQLSGVGRLLEPQQVLWYRREFTVDDIVEGKRCLLHFDAVDYECKVWMNGVELGSHRGGNTPFTFDASAAVRQRSTGESNLVLLRVIDRTDGYQGRGKQKLNPEGIFYTRVSGIWQNVWLEIVPETYVASLHIETSIEPATIRVQAAIVGHGSGLTLRVRAFEGETHDGGSGGGAPKGTDVAAATEKVVVCGGGEGGGGSGVEVASAEPAAKKARLQSTATVNCSLIVPGAKLWSPTTPYLYPLIVEVLDPSGQVLDTLASYAGIRVVGKRRDDRGDLRLTLNGEFLFHWGTLDQGWWPDGLLTPPSEEAMCFDVDFLKQAGFNMIRKHVKVEPRRFYHYCDKIGMLVWQDQVAFCERGVPPWTRFGEVVDAEWPDWAHEQFMAEFKEMIDSLRNAPSIVVWTPFNEAWGQHRTMEVGKWVQEYDPSRLVSIASGGNFWPVGDIASNHNYPHPSFDCARTDKRLDDFVRVVGEFGGHGYVEDVKHVWQNTTAKSWGYGGLPQSREELKERYKESIKRLAELVKTSGVAAGVYTQTTDVEIEVNGLMTYDRHIVKLAAAELAPIHSEFLRIAADAPKNTKET